jgi:hypothetical protein
LYRVFEHAVDFVGLCSRRFEGINQPESSSDRISADLVDAPKKATERVPTERNCKRVIPLRKLCCPGSTVDAVKASKELVLVGERDGKFRNCRSRRTGDS